MYFPALNIVAEDVNRLKTLDLLMEECKEDFNERDINRVTGLQLVAQKIIQVVRNQVENMPGMVFLRNPNAKKSFLNTEEQMDSYIKEVIDNEIKCVDPEILRNTDIEINENGLIDINEVKLTIMIIAQETLYNLAHILERFSETIKYKY